METMTDLLDVHSFDKHLTGFDGMDEDEIILVFHQGCAPIPDHRTWLQRRARNRSTLLNSIWFYKEICKSEEAQGKNVSSNSSYCVCNVDSQRFSRMKITLPCATSCFILE